MIILGDQATGMLAGPSRVPAGRLLARQASMDLDRGLYVLSLIWFREPVIVNPPVAMACDLVVVP